MIKLMPHNEAAVKEILNDYHAGVKKICYVSGVGTGKTYTFMAVAEQIEGKILYVIPKYSIKENIVNYNDFFAMKNKVTFITFNQFSSIAKSKKLIDDYNMVVIDECHHLGSDLYGRNLLDIMTQDTERLYLGLTATPVRFNTKTRMPDGTIRKDVDISVFFEKKVDGISNFDAIRLGLMPPFQYRLLEPDKDPRQLEEEYGYEVKVVENFDNESYGVVKEITKMYPRNKWICFFSSKDNLKNNEDNIKAVFPGYKIFTLYSDLRNLKEVIDGVIKAEKAVILSIDMLLEGVHLPDITGIILFRNVTTVSTFQQILGRVCSIGNKIEPLVVDCSKCGPKLLQQLLSESKNIGKAIFSKPGTSKPVMFVGVGLHRGWDQVDTFLARLADLNRRSYHRIDDKTLESIVEDYLRLGGDETDDIEKLSKNNKSLLKACCWKYSVDIQVFQARITQIHNGKNDVA